MPAQLLKKQQQKALARNDITTAEQLWSEAQLIAKSSAKKEDAAIAYQMEGALLHAKFDYPRAITVYELAVKIYKSVRNNLALADVLSDLSTVYYSRGQYRQVVILLEQVIGLAEPIGHTETVAHARNQIGLSQSQLGDLGAAVKNCSIAVELFDQINNPVAKAKALQNLSIAYFKLGDFEKATTLLLEAIPVLEKLNETLILARCFTSLGGLLNASGNFEKALEYHHHARNLHQSLCNNVGVYFATYNISVVLNKMKRYEESLEEVKKALELTNDTSRLVDRCRAHVGVATNYMAMNRPTDAHEHCEVALQLATEIEDSQILAYVKGTMGTLYMQSGRYAEAKALLNETLEMLTAKEMWPDVILAEDKLYEIAQTEGDNAAALHHYRQRTEIQHRLNDIQMQQRLLLLQIQFDSERKDAELVRLREEKEFLVQQKQNSSTLYHLTPRELAILKLLTDGLSYKQTAAHLGIAYETAKEHVGNLYKKLGVKTNTEAVAKAMKEGLV